MALRAQRIKAFSVALSDFGLRGLRVEPCFAPARLVLRVRTIALTEGPGLGMQMSSALRRRECGLSVTEHSACGRNTA
jgi:hypothetical protein